MKILHICSQKRALASGVAEAVRNYCTFEAKKEKVALFSLGCAIGPTGVKEFSKSDYKKIEELPNGFSDPDLVIFNEVYKPEYIALYRECIKRQINYLIIPHGSLVREAQRCHWFKKKLGNTLLFNDFIRHATAIRFLSDNEKSNSICFNHNSFVVNNGTKIIPKHNYHRQNILFLGRYDIHVKGIDLIIKVCQEHKEWFLSNNIKIILHGYAEKTTLDALGELAAKNHILDILELNGPIYGRQKYEVIQHARVFIAPSRNEGSPLSILEALASGTPCVVTPGTTLYSYINSHNCGKGTTDCTSDIFDAIKEVYTSPHYAALCKNARRCAISDFSWPKVTQEALRNYRSVLPKTSGRN